MENKYVKHIETINYHAQQFLSAFARFRNDFNGIDRTLCANLTRIVSEIDKFIESKPKEVFAPQKEQITVADLVKLGLHNTFFCNQCKIECGKTFEHARAHLKSSRHINGKRERASNGKTDRKEKLENKTLPKKTKSLLLCPLQTFFSDSIARADKLIKLQDYNVIENALLSLIRPQFPDTPVKVYLFGSRISGIGNVYSDLDIFVDIGNVFNTFENTASRETIKKLNTVQVAVKKSPDWLLVLAIPNARVPILKIFNKTTSTSCDVGFSNSLGFCNTKLIRYLLDLQPLARALSLFMKRWLERSKLNIHITTYSVVLMIVYHFQHQKLLPSVKALQDDLDVAMDIGPWLATFAEKSLSDLEIPLAQYSIDSIKKELCKFFKFYGSFDFQQKVISPFLGHTIDIADFDTSPLLPRYVKYIEAEKEAKDATLKKSFMNVQDPFQLNHNVTKAVPLSVLQQLKQYFNLSADLLTSDGPSIPQIVDLENLKK